MVDIYEYNEVRWPTRALQQEEEEYAEKHAVKLLEPPLLQWSPTKGDTTGPCELLVVSCSTGGSALLHSCIKDQQPLGVALLPRLPTLSSAEEQEEQRVPSMAISRASGGSLVLCTSRTPVPAEQSRGLAVALLDHVKPRHVLVLGSMQGEQFQDEGDPSQEFMAFLVQPHVLPGSDVAPIPYLPSGNIVGGLPAAMLTQCQVRGLASELVVSVDMVPHLVADTLGQLSAVIQKVVVEGCRGLAAGRSLVQGMQDAEALQAARQECEKKVPGPSLYA